MDLNIRPDMTIKVGCLNGNHPRAYKDQTIWLPVSTESVRRCIQCGWMENLGGQIDGLLIDKHTHDFEDRCSTVNTRCGIQWQGALYFEASHRWKGIGSTKRVSSAAAFQVHLGSGTYHTFQMDAYWFTPNSQTCPYNIRCKTTTALRISFDLIAAEMTKVRGDESLDLA